MSTTANAIYLRSNGHLVPLDLDDDTTILPNYQANDRTKPDTIQSDFSAEFSVPGSARNHRLLKHAAASQPAQGSAYVRVPAVLTSGGVEVLPLALLYIKGYSEGRYNLQLFGGNRRLVEALGDKKLRDLELSRFDHDWVPATILAGLPYDYWQANGWGYELYDRGKALDLVNVDPYTLYPSCSANLVWTQVLADAGFTADSLLNETLWAQLNVPSANPFTFPDDYLEARGLKAGFAYNPVPASNDISDRRKVGVGHEQEFAAEKLNFNYTGLKPFVGPTAGATFVGGTYQVATLGYYDVSATAQIRYGCRGDLFGQVSCKVLIYINGQPVYDALGKQIGVDEHRITDNAETDGGSGYLTRAFSPELKRYLLHPTDVVEIWWQGDEWKTGFGGGPVVPPTDPYWQFGPVKSASTPYHLPDGRDLLTGSNFTVALLKEFPPGGRVKLNEWLPDMKQLDFVKAMMLVMGLTIQADQYTPHLRLAPGSKLLVNLVKAKDWTAKRDAATVPGRLPERDLTFRFGSYGQANTLGWEEDDHVTPGYGDGLIRVADEVLPATYEMAKLPFAATEIGKQVPGLLQILNFEASDLTVSPPTYTAIEAKPRLVLRPDGPVFYGQLILVPATPTTAAVMASYTSVASYFDSLDLSLELNRTVLTEYWADLRAMLDQSRYLTERYRLTPQDIAELDFSVPIWDGGLGDYFAISQISEYDARRPVEVKLCRLCASHLGPPRAPGAGSREWYSAEWYQGEWY